MMTTMRWLTLVLATVATVALALLAMTIPTLAGPRLGHQGQNRHLARESVAWLRVLDPVLRYFAGVVSLIPVGALRSRQQRLLRSAGFPLGLSCDEVSALSILSAIAFAALAYVPVSLGRSGPGLIGAGLALGLALPTLRLREIVFQRAKDIRRELPHAIEIAAMCMGAGLDFPGAIRLVSQPMAGTTTPLGAELRLVLDELELGHTRREALFSFGERVPTEAVRDFVHAVVQAEEKGNPLSEILRIQGQVLGRRRSTRAEEAAARAGVMLVIPLLLLLTCVLALLIGPAVLSNGLFR